MSLQFTHRLHAVHHMHQSTIEVFTEEKTVCKDLRYQVMKIIKYEKKEMIPLTNDENKSHEQ